MLFNDKLSDEELIKTIRENNSELYSEIIHRYQNKLSHYLRKFINSPDELEDVLQEVFIKAYKNLYDFDTKKKFSSWVYRIAHNEAVNYLKKNSKIKLSLDKEEVEIIDQKINIPDKFDSLFLKAQIEKGLTQMKAKYREVIILYFFEQKTYEEISDILHMPINTVATLISRGKKTLKQYFEQQIYAGK